MSNRFGEKIRMTIFGQSHAPAIGAVIEGIPAGLTIDMKAIGAFMGRRAPGGALATPRKEDDRPRLLSGLNERGQTCGAPLCVIIENRDTRPADYDELRDLPRPGHADYTAHVKFSGANDIRGGGPSSGRLTAPMCFAGALCMQLPAFAGVRIGARIVSIGGQSDRAIAPGELNASMLDALAQKSLPVLDDDAAKRMRQAILDAKAQDDSVGGVIEAYALGVPAGLGEPMFDGLENRIAQAVFGIPAVRGIEFGTGFEASNMRGSAHNDAYAVDEGGKIMTTTNHHGGILGGISSGMPIVFRVAFKPTSSIGQPQQTVSLSALEQRTLTVQGRHDPCIVTRAVPCVEAALALALADFLI